MAVSLYRQIILLVMVNLVIGMVVSIYYHPYTYETNIIGEDTNKISQDVINIGGEFEQGDIVTGSQIQSETTWGNKLSLSKNIVGILWNGLNPFSLVGINDGSSSGNIILALTLFRSIILALVGLEVFYLVYTRKPS